jgi:hypothetical protein
MSGLIYCDYTIPLMVIDHLEDLGINGRILKNWAGVVRTGLICIHIVACFTNAGWMTFRNLKERDCNSSGALHVLPPLPNPRYGLRARWRHAFPCCRTTASMPEAEGSARAVCVRVCVRVEFQHEVEVWVCVEVAVSAAVSSGGRSSEQWSMR